MKGELKKVEIKRFQPFFVSYARKTCEDLSKHKLKKEKLRRGLDECSKSLFAPDLLFNFLLFATKLASLPVNQNCSFASIYFDIVLIIHTVQLWTRLFK